MNKCDRYYISWILYILWDGFLYFVQVLLVVILLFIIAIICYLIQNIGQNKENYWHTNNVRMENNELKKIGISNRSYYFDDIIKIEDVDFNKFLLVKK